MPKQWIVNVCAVVLGAQFKQWVHYQIKERNTIMCTKKEMMITMDPQMAAKFGASSHVSCKLLSVRSHDLLFVHSDQGCLGKFAEGLLEKATNP